MMDEREFNRAVVAALPMLRSYCLGLARSRADAEDLAHDTIIRAIGARANFDGRNMHAWLATIAYRRFLTTIRDGRRMGRMKYVTQDDVPFDLLPEMATRPTQMDGRVLDDAIRCIKAMPAAHRRALIAIRLRGERPEEYAASIGAPMGTIKSRLHRARLRLAEVRP